MPVFGHVVEPPAEPASNIVAQYEAADAVLSGSDVVSLADKTANNNDLTAVGTPQYDAAGLNGLPTIYFNGTTDSLVGTVLANLPEGNVDRTMLCVMRFVSKNYGGFGYGDVLPYAQFTLAQYPSNEYAFISGNGGSETDADHQTGVFGTDWIVFNVVHTAAGGTPGAEGRTTIWRNNVKIGTFDQELFTSAIALVIGQDVNDPNFRELHFAEAVVYDIAMDATELTEAQQFYIDKYLLNEPAIFPVINGGAASISAADMDVNSAPLDFVAPTLTATNSTGGILTWSLSSDGTNGTAVCSGTGVSPGVLDYTPDTDWSGDDSFVVLVTNDDGNTDTITVNIRVLAAADQNPDDQDFNSLTLRDPTTQYPSNLLTLTGMNTDTTPSKDANIDDYRIDGGSWITSGGTVNAASTIEVRLTSSGSDDTVKVGVLSVGTTDFSFSVKTSPALGQGTLVNCDFEGTEAEVSAANAPWYIKGTPNCGISTRYNKGGTRSMVGTFGPDADGEDSRVEFDSDLGGQSNAQPDLWFAFDMYVGANYTHRNSSGPDNNKMMHIWGGETSAYNNPETRWGSFFQVKIERQSDGSSSFHCNGLGREWLTTNTSTPVKGIDYVVNASGTYYQPPGAFSNAIDVNKDLGKWMRLTWHIKQASGIGMVDGKWEAWKTNWEGTTWKMFDVQDIDCYATLPGQPGVDGAGFNHLRIWGWSNSGFLEATDLAVDNLLITTDDITPT